MHFPPPDVASQPVCPPGQQLVNTHVPVEINGVTVYKQVTIAVPIGSQVVGGGLPTARQQQYPPHIQPPQQHQKVLPREPPASGGPRAPYGARLPPKRGGGLHDEGRAGSGSNKRPFGDLRGERERDGAAGGGSFRDRERDRDRESKRARGAGGGRPERDRGTAQQRGGQQQADKPARSEPVLSPALQEPVTELEVQRVRTLVVEQMQALLDNCKEKGETPAAEVHGFLLSRVKELYLSRHKVELDHRSYGCSKMRDIVTLLFADLAKVECTPQKATVLMPLEGKEYKDVEAAAGGEGLKKAMAEVQASRERAIAVNLASGGGRARESARRQQQTGGDASDDDGTGVDALGYAKEVGRDRLGDGSKRRRFDEHQQRQDVEPPPVSRAIEKGTIAALKSRMASAEAGRQAGVGMVSDKEREMVSQLEQEREQMLQQLPAEERVEKLVTKMCHRTMLAQRFQLHMEAVRLLRNRHGPGMYGVGHSRTNLVVPGAVDLTTGLRSLEQGGGRGWNMDDLENGRGSRRRGEGSSRGKEGAGRGDKHERNERGGERSEKGRSERSEKGEKEGGKGGDKGEGAPPMETEGAMKDSAQVKQEVGDAVRAEAQQQDGETSEKCGKGEAAAAKGVKDVEKAESREEEKAEGKAPEESEKEQKKGDVKEEGGKASEGDVKAERSEGDQKPEEKGEAHKEGEVKEVKVEPACEEGKEEEKAELKAAETDAKDKPKPSKERKSLIDEYVQPAPPVKEVAERLAPRFALSVSDLRKRWVTEAQLAYGLSTADATVGVLANDHSLLTFLREQQKEGQHRREKAEGTPAASDDWVVQFVILTPEDAKAKEAGMEGTEAQGMKAEAEEDVRVAVIKVEDDKAKIDFVCPKEEKAKSEEAAKAAAEAAKQEGAPDAGQQQQAQGDTEMAEAGAARAGPAAGEGAAADASKDALAVEGAAQPMDTEAAAGAEGDKAAEEAKKKAEAHPSPSQEQIAFAGAHKLMPVLGSVWDVRKILDVWNLLHVALLDHAYAAAPEKQPYGQPPAIPQPPAYPVTKLREDFKRAHGSSLQIAPLGFTNLVDFLQWMPVFADAVIVDRPQAQRERGTLRPVFGPLKNLRMLLEQRMSELVAKDAAQVRAARIEASHKATTGDRVPVPLTSLTPEDGFRMDAIKSDFKNRFGYELDNKRLGFESFRALVEANEDLVQTRNLGSTYMLLPAPLMRLRVLLGARLAPGSPPLQIASLDGLYRASWGSTFDKLDSGYHNVLHALQGLGDICTVNDARRTVVAARSGSECTGMTKLRRQSATTLLQHHRNQQAQRDREREREREREQLKQERQYQRQSAAAMEPMPSSRLPPPSRGLAAPASLAATGPPQYHAMPPPGAAQPHTQPQAQHVNQRKGANTLPPHPRAGSRQPQPAQPAQHASSLQPQGVPSLPFPAHLLAPQQAQPQAQAPAGLEALMAAMGAGGSRGIDPVLLSMIADAASVAGLLGGQAPRPAPVVQPTLPAGFDASNPLALMLADLLTKQQAAPQGPPANSLFQQNFGNLAGALKLGQPGSAPLPTGPPALALPPSVPGSYPNPAGAFGFPTSLPAQQPPQYLQPQSLGLNPLVPGTQLPTGPPQGLGGVLGSLPGSVPLQPPQQQQPTPYQPTLPGPPPPALDGTGLLQQSLMGQGAATPSTAHPQLHSREGYPSMPPHPRSGASQPHDTHRPGQGLMAGKGPGGGPSSAAPSGMAGVGGKTPPTSGPMPSPQHGGILQQFKAQQQGGPPQGAATSRQQQQQQQGPGQKPAGPSAAAAAAGKSSSAGGTNPAQQQYEQFMAQQAQQVQRVQAAQQGQPSGPAGASQQGGKPGQSEQAAAASAVNAGGAAGGVEPAFPHQQRPGGSASGPQPSPAPAAQQQQQATQASQSISAAQASATAYHYQQQAANPALPPGAQAQAANAALYYSQLAAAGGYTAPSQADQPATSAAPPTSAAMPTPASGPSPAAAAAAQQTAMRANITPGAAGTPPGFPAVPGTPATPATPGTPAAATDPYQQWLTSSQQQQQQQQARQQQPAQPAAGLPPYPGAVTPATSMPAPTPAPNPATAAAGGGSNMVDPSTDYAAYQQQWAAYYAAAAAAQQGGPGGSSAPMPSHAHPATSAPMPSPAAPAAGPQPGAPGLGAGSMYGGPTPYGVAGAVPPYTSMPTQPQQQQPYGAWPGMGQMPPQGPPGYNMSGWYGAP